MRRLIELLYCALVLFGILIGLAYIGGVLGCANLPRDSRRVIVPESTAPVGTAIAKAEIHVEGARADVIAAKPESSKLGRVILDQGDAKLGRALAELVEAHTALDHARNTELALSADNETLREQIAQMVPKSDYEKLAGDPWVQAALKLKRIWFWVKVSAGVWLTLWLGLSIGSLFVAGPAGAAMSIAAAVLNPGEWVRVIRDNLFFRGKVPASNPASNPKGAPP